MSTKKIVAAVFATVFMIVFAILNPFRSASAEPTQQYLYTWNPCAPVVWSYLPPTTDDGRGRNQVRTLKALVAATSTIQRISGYQFRQAEPGETPNVTVEWTFFEDRMRAAEMEIHIDSQGPYIISGAMRLDTASVPQKKADIKFISMHEFGHVLGLNHSDKPLQVMSSTVSTVPNTTLTQDDRDAFAGLPDCVS